MTKVGRRRESRHRRRNKRRLQRRHCRRGKRRRERRLPRGLRCRRRCRHGVIWVHPNNDYTSSLRREADADEEYDEGPIERPPTDRKRLGGALGHLYRRSLRRSGDPFWEDACLLEEWCCVSATPRAASSRVTPMFVGPSPPLLPLQSTLNDAFL